MGILFQSPSSVFVLFRSRLVRSTLPLKMRTSGMANYPFWTGQMPGYFESIIPYCSAVEITIFARLYYSKLHYSLVFNPVNHNYIHCLQNRKWNLELPFKHLYDWNMFGDISVRAVGQKRSATTFFTGWLIRTPQSILAIHMHNPVRGTHSLQSSNHCFRMFQGYSVSCS